MTQRDDKTPWPDEGEPEPTEEELRQARALGDSLDRVLGGDQPRDELSATALLVQASVHERRLEPRRRDSLLDQAVTEAGQRRRFRGLRRVAPVVMALAACFMLVVTGLLFSLPAGRDAAEAPAAHSAEVSTQTLSRPSDDLIGRPFADRAGASRRLDTVFEDRLRGYRLVIFAERGQP